MTTALTRQQQTDLRACEQVISKGINTFRDVGKALAKIRDDKLYKSEYKTFEAYANTRWGFSRVHAHRLIEAADVPEVLPTGNKIETERQARKYLDEQKAESKPKPVIAEFDFGDEDNHPVADDSDDDQDADGGAEPVTSGPLAGLEPDPVGDLPGSVTTAAADFREWLLGVVKRHWDNDNGELTTAILSNELWLLSEEVLTWK